MFHRIVLTFSRGEFKQLLLGPTEELKAKAPQPPGRTHSAYSQVEPGPLNVQGFLPKLRRRNMDNSLLSLRQARWYKEVHFSLSIADQALSVLNVHLTTNSGLPKKLFKNSQLLLQALKWGLEETDYRQGSHQFWEAALRRPGRDLRSNWNFHYS